LFFYFSIKHKKPASKVLAGFFSKILAEKEGFEPPVRCRTMVFKTTAFDHSAISPAAKVKHFLIPAIQSLQKKIFICSFQSYIARYQALRCLFFLHKQKQKFFIVSMRLKKVPLNPTKHQQN
jgi:hypothetical protein